MICTLYPVSALLATVEAGSYHMGVHLLSDWNVTEYVGPWVKLGAGLEKICGFAKCIPQICHHCGQAESGHVHCNCTLYMCGKNSKEK